MVKKNILNDEWGRKKISDDLLLAAMVICKISQYHHRGISELLPTSKIYCDLLILSPWTVT